MEKDLTGVYTLILATLVLLLGSFILRRVKFLRDYNIPEPVVGGIPLIIFVVVVGILIVIQDVVGVTMASMLSLKPLMGLITGSITLSGGHGTAGSWGGILETEYGIKGAVALGMAVATFGLVSGGIVGGPIARFLIRRINARKVAVGAAVIEPLDESVDKDQLRAQQHALAEKAVKAGDVFAPQGQTSPVEHVMFTDVHEPRLITSMSALETLTLYAVCLVSANLFTDYVSNALPTFVWALMTGIVVRNVLTRVFSFDMFDRAIDLLGNVALSLYLAIALLSLDLWQLADLAGPVMIILAVQVVVMVLFAVFVTFITMGRDYDAAVLTAGHCGFGLGATPTAIANMQAVTDKFGPSPKAIFSYPWSADFHRSGQHRGDQKLSEYAVSTVMEGKFE